MPEEYRSRGDFVSTDDVIELVEIQCALDALPWLFKKYYLAKAGYFVRRTKSLGLAVATGLVLLGVLVYARSSDLLLSILLVIIGVAVGLALAWEIDRKK
jgi:xanthine/uracil permease